MELLSLDEADATEEQKAAVLRIQHKFRVWRGSKLLKAKIRQTYIKVYDKINDEYLYKNRLTGEIFNEKPRLLGTDDLPNPVRYNAPLNYDPHNIDDDGFCLLVTVAVFNSDRIPELPKECITDHQALEELLPHSYICKFRSENFMSLLNPTCADFQDAVTRFKRTTTKQGFLFVYICTHVATVWKGEDKKNSLDKNETAYFLFQDTVWKDAKTVAKTSIALTALAQIINEIPCERKTIAINCAHETYKKPTMFASKILYPPGDFSIRLSELTKSAVITSCTTGTATSDLVRYDPVLMARLNIIQEADMEERRVKKLAEEDYSSDEEHIAEFVLTNDRKKGITFGPLAKLVEQLKLEWKLPKEKVISRSEKPDLPVPTYERQRNGEYNVTLPTDALMKEYDKAVFYWKLQSSLETPVRYIREKMKAAHEVVSEAPRQVSKSGAYSTVFGEAFKKACQGGVASMLSPYCNAITVFKFVLQQMIEITKKMEIEHYDAEVKKIRAEANDGGFGEIEGGEEHEIVPADETPEQALERAKKKKESKKKKKHKKKTATREAVMVHIPQTPVFVVPLTLQEASEFPICFACGPPAQPEKPFVKRTRDTDVALEWFNPPFDGIGPSHYEVYFRNNTRNFNHWTLVKTAAPIRSCSFIVRELPMGVPVKFRVIAHNMVGPSLPSAETIMVTPGEERCVPITSETKWQRLVLGGPLSILDYMKLHSLDRGQQLLGMSKLIAYAQKEDGFPKGKTRMRSAECAMRILATFKDDPEVVAQAFFLVSYALCGKKDQTEVLQCVLSEGLKDIVEKSVEKYRRHSKILSSVTRLRLKIPTLVEPIKPFPPESVEAETFHRISLSGIPIEFLPDAEKKGLSNSVEDDDEFDLTEDDLLRYMKEIAPPLLPKKSIEFPVIAHSSAMSKDSKIKSSHRA